MKNNKNNNRNNNNFCIIIISDKGPVDKGNNFTLKQFSAQNIHNTF